ncbi:THUMP domain-containing class I SAM-dependent RNA methyltransferase [Trichlorobacter sp.]|uniref:THUMP domain-containing class I SAM-dependent RNA methyltransferase n=1 Tax=Trichlorobacter sp. TaxID=2911007 RepID=UPI002A361AAC|nr:THUMP domain-containing protein [Trichlorobacter sp.]MDY0385392.1 THUMP domain-containing protein [Trichlorobacter sp.]
MSETSTVIRRKGAAAVAASRPLALFATVALGVEELTAGELQRLGASEIQVVRGGVSFGGDRRILYRSLLRLRTASRVLVQLGSFPCASPQELYDGIRALSWTELLTPAMTLAVDCTLRDSAITHSHFAALKAKDAIVDLLRDTTGSRPNIETKAPDLRVNLHIAKNRATVSLDASGAPLDRRGWRLDRNDAPLRETLAAAIMLHTGWDGSVPLLDPMCGSGTLLLEGAAMALGQPAGGGREFGLMRWRDFDRRLWERLLQEEQAAAASSLTVPVLGFDRDPKSIIACRENARRAGLEYAISFDRRPFEDTEPCGHQGVLVMNPPYGVRMGDKSELEGLYRKIGEVFKRRFTGWTAYLLAGDLELARLVGLKPARRFVLFNGPLECRLLKYELY